MRSKAGQFLMVLGGVLLLQGQPLIAQSDPQPRAATDPKTAPKEAIQQTANAEPEKATGAIENHKPNHKWHVKLATVSVGAGYSYTSTPFIDPFYPYGFWGPGLVYLLIFMLLTTRTMAATFPG